MNNFKIYKPWCASCIFLDKTIKQTGENGIYRYGCKHLKNGKYICFWCSSDKDLSLGGCSYYLEKNAKLKQGQLFRLFTESNHKNMCQYCGKVKGKYLIWNQTLKMFKVVKQSWFREHIHQIVLTNDLPTKYTTTEEKQQFRKRLAQSRKQRYLQEHNIHV